MIARSSAGTFFPVFSKRTGRFPHANGQNRESLLPGFVEDQLRDALDRGVAFELVDRFAERLQGTDERIVMPQNHLVIELTVYPALDEPLDVGEISHHIS